MQPLPLLFNIVPRRGYVNERNGRKENLKHRISMHRLSFDDLEKERYDDIIITVKVKRVCLDDYLNTKWPLFCHAFGNESRIIVWMQ